MKTDLLHQAAAFLVLTEDEILNPYLRSCLLDENMAIVVSRENREILGSGKKSCFVIEKILLGYEQFSYEVLAYFLGFIIALNPWDAIVVLNVSDLSLRRLLIALGYQQMSADNEFAILQPARRDENACVS